MSFPFRNQIIPQASGPCLSQVLGATGSRTSIVFATCFLVSIFLSTNSQAKAGEEARFRQLADQAKAARLAERPGEAIKLYCEALNLQPDWPEGWWYVGDLSYGEGKYRECQQGFEHFLKLQPDFAPAHALMGLCFYHLGQYQPAMGSLQQARQLGLDDSDKALGLTARYYIALAEIGRGLFGSAIDTLKYFVQEHIDSEDPTLAMGLAMLRLSADPDRLDPATKAVVLKVGHAAFLAGERHYPEAELAYQELLKAYPRAPNLYYCYGLYLYLVDRTPEALQAFNKEIKLFPQNVEARVEIAYLLRRAGNYAQGLKYAQEAVQLDPESYAAQYELGEALLKTGQRDVAITHLETANRLNPDIAAMHYGLMLAYAQSGRKADAAREAETFQMLKKQGVDKG